MSKYAMDLIAQCIALLGAFILLGFCLVAVVYEWKIYRPTKDTK